MNIIEAAKSGKRFKRKIWGRFEESDLAGQVKIVAVGDILADDWEIEEKKVEITNSQFYEAYRRMLVSDGCSFTLTTTNSTSACISHTVHRLAKELGLED